MTEPRHDLLRRLAERRHRHRSRHIAYRLAVVAAGVVVTLTGVAMLVLPGPAIVVIPAGLALLALEFTWAERLLARALDHAERARRTARLASRGRRLLAGFAVVCAVVAAVAAARAWDIPLLPV